MRRGGLLTLGSLLALLLAAPGAGAQGLPGYKVEYFPGDLPLPSPSISLPQEDWP
jgi:hypothetical protein